MPHIMLISSLHMLCYKHLTQQTLCCCVFDVEQQSQCLTHSYDRAVKGQFPGCNLCFSMKFQELLNTIKFAHVYVTG